jgi:hypothetical protein
LLPVSSNGGMKTTIKGGATKNEKKKEKQPSVKPFLVDLN